MRRLATLSQGYGDGFTGKVKSPLACEAPYHLNKANLSIVAKVTEAIHKGKALRWHVRAFDRTHGQSGAPNGFRDFVLTQIKTAAVFDYGMTDGALKVEISAATAGYLLRQWHVGC